MLEAEIFVREFLIELEGEYLGLIYDGQLGRCNFHFTRFKVVVLGVDFISLETLLNISCDLDYVFRTEFV